MFDIDLDKIDFDENDTKLDSPSNYDNVKVTVIKKDHYSNDNTNDNTNDNINDNINDN